MRKKLFLIAFVTLAGNLVLGYFILKGNQNRLISSNLVEHTLRVGFEVERLDVSETHFLSILKSYKLTTDSSFITPMYIAERNMLTSIERLTKLTHDNPVQQQRVKSLYLKVKLFLDYSFGQVGLRVLPDDEANKLISTTAAGMPNEIRRSIATIQDEESGLLRARLNYSSQVINELDWLTFVACVCLFVFTITLWFTLRRILEQGKATDLRAQELILANQVLFVENKEKAKRADELMIAGQELSFQNTEKQNRAAELALANKELFHQNYEKEQRAAELVIANRELSFQNQEKEKRAAELGLANTELNYQNLEKEKRAVELKDTIALLNQSEVFNRGVLNSLSSHIAVMDHSGKLVAVNESWRRFSALNGSTLLQHTDVDSNYFAACIRAMRDGNENAGHAMTGIMEVFEEIKTVFHMEYSCHSPEKQRWYAIRAIKFEGSGNLVVVSHRDISERKLAEQNLLISESSLKEAQSIAHIGSYEMNLLSEVHIWSDEMYHILGFDKEHIVPSMPALFDRIHPVDLQRVKDSLAVSFQSFKVSNLEFRFIHGDGSVRYAKTESQFEMNEQAKPLRLFGVLQDITEARLAEQEKTDMVTELRTRNRDLEQFAYIVSHNLRSPIANILGASNALKDADLTDDDKSVLKEGIHSSVLKLDSVVNDLNQILQVRTGVNDQKETVNFADLLGDIVATMGQAIVDYNITIKSDFSSFRDMYTLKPYLYSIFHNLISNSIKYRQVTIPLQIYIKSAQTSHGHELIFADNGMGIDLLKKGDEVFGMYKRFHPGVEGKGMGLFMVKTQVETLNGKISLKSKVNQGCTFTITFPG